ncbi:putative RNA-binding protein Luc7-like 1 [Drosophila grimshawi]|uniref:GH16088 n=1 Tax=Drosophila grimshawi TaxID=7222 RepID=B4J364_DROGR|nr:putative RNA-binding protein Luc7-like 1 [Drosophila grimshawi]XP_043071434.1 putative RNA-binding protein Luc7-like 1 [Drosophila grimshawi]EDV96135.1 GH16088 [Drosophila grimshawi]
MSAPSNKMSATDQMRAMLDQLMGTTRNGDDGRGLKFSDARVCKSFLLDCCPHDILASTRMDLGECPKVHDLAFRADYESANKSRDYYYDIEAMEHLQAFIADCDRRTDSAKQRLKETQEELTAEVAEKANAVHSLAEEIGKKLAKAEALGEAGEVEDSMELMKEIDELRGKKIKAEHEYRTSMPASTYQQQKLRVCEVCSAYLGIHDNDIRLADHFGGKLHLGFLTIREKLIELEKTAAPRKAELKRSGKIPDREEDGRGRNRYFVGGRELDRRSRVHRSRSRERQRQRDAEKSDRSNDRSADRGSSAREAESERGSAAQSRGRDNDGRGPSRGSGPDQSNSRDHRDRERDVRRDRDRSTRNDRGRFGGGGGGGGGGDGGSRGGGGLSDRRSDRRRSRSRDRSPRNDRRNNYNNNNNFGNRRRSFSRERYRR